MLKVIFDNPVSEGDITRHAITTDYMIVDLNAHFFRPYPEGKSVYRDGLSDPDAVLYDAFMEMAKRNMKDEYQTGAVTARKAAKQPQGEQE
jgi:hypothetical protein